jgi:hypothetical protein
MVLTASQVLSSLHVVIVHVYLPMDPPTWSTAAATRCIQSVEPWRLGVARPQARTGA